MTWCKTFVTPSHLWRSYNSFAPSPWFTTDYFKFGGTKGDLWAVIHRYLKALYICLVCGIRRDQFKSAVLKSVRFHTYSKEPISFSIMLPLLLSGFIYLDKLNAVGGKMCYIILQTVDPNQWLFFTFPYWWLGAKLL